MNNLNLVQEEITGSLTITQNTQYNNVDADSIILEKNVTARIYGNTNTVILKEGSVLYLHGKSPAKVENTRGTLHVFTK